MMPTCSGSRRSARLWPAAAALLLCVPSLQAQYFGRNKVVYREFDFRILRTPHYDVHFYPEEARATRDVGRMAERWYQRHYAMFGDTVGRRSLILYASPAEFQQTNVIPGELGEGTGGVTEGYRSRVTMPLTGVYHETDHVLGHELVHVFQYSAAIGPVGGGIESTARLPLWLVEGMAEYLSIGRADPQTAMWMRSAVLRDDVPKYKDLTDPRIFPYRYGQAICAYIGGRWGDERLIQLYKAALRLPLEAAIQKTLSITADQLVAEWTTAMQELYRPAMAGRTDPRDSGVPILAERQKEAGLDVAPVVSPDGKYVAFFSSRGLFSIDIYIADVASGRIVKRLTSATGSSHYDALSFVYNAGAWSPDAKEFAFVTFANGRNELAIVNVDQAAIVRRLAVRDVGAITNPTWSPDGAQIAFSGQAGGVSDLYIYNIAAGSVVRLTNDAYADLQPAWSPDGKFIAFVTDRGATTDLAKLAYGPLGVATIDVASKVITRLSLFADDNTLNPQWTPDSRGLYFLSTPDGFQDIYRVDLATGALFRVTRVATGISGIAALSPALSVAASTGRVFFSVFDRTGYRMMALDASQA
ncbi:MAG: basic secretory protein-like protein, partial [Gemmatimonadaceae bacterium]